MPKHQVDSIFVANNSDPRSSIREERSKSILEYPFSPSGSTESESGSLICNGTNPEFPLSIASLFPAYNSETDASSESNEIPSKYSHYSNSIMSLFSPARSQRDEILIPNPSIPANDPTSLYISLLFPPAISETETDGSCSESREKPPRAAQFSYSIASCFPPARSGSSSSENYEIIPIYPAPISARSKGTIQIATFKDMVEFLMGKSRDSSNSNRTPRKILLLKVTCNFFKGRFASGYRAILYNSGEVAIMRYKKSGCDISNDLFLCDTFCEIGNECLLVTKNVSNNFENVTLHDHLHKLQRTPLTSWVARIQVALFVAIGIEFLHLHAAPPIIHRNINSFTILLDATLTIKLFDSGLCVKVPEGNESDHLSDLVVCGTLGYLDPEYLCNQQLTTKIDVYSFGVVLLEMLTGYKAVHKNENGEQRLLVDFIVPYIAQYGVYGVLDPKVPPPNPFEMEALAHVGSLAVDCASQESRKRPSMTEIVGRLHRALDEAVYPDHEAEYHKLNPSGQGGEHNFGILRPNIRQGEEEHNFGNGRPNNFGIRRPNIRQGGEEHNFGIRRPNIRQGWEHNYGIPLLYNIRFP